jgi:molybdopterin-containing oxidoreductase family iron-sulfur binding subunit
LKEHETALVSTIAAPVPHYLEAWGDLSITKGASFNATYNPSLFDTKQFEDVLMNLNGILVITMII